MCSSLQSDFIKFIPSLFQINLNIDKKGESLFRHISKIINFDEGFIYYLNPSSLQLKYSYKTHRNYKLNTIFPINESMKKNLYSQNSELEYLGGLVKCVGLENLKKKSYIAAKISIKDTVFGVMLLAKKEPDYYTENDRLILNAMSSIVSYLLKDIELSNVFKIQLSALKNGVEEKHNAYKMIKEQNEKILEADRVKNEFLANVSHELRTPLNSILGFSEILSTGIYGPLNEKQKEYIDDIRVSSTHLLGMINEILDMSKLEAHAMRLVRSNFPISRAINEVCNITKPLVEKKSLTVNINLETDFEVYADYQKIQQIMYNLISNAIKFSPKSGNIEITAEQTAENFKISVHDNGIGIDPKYHGKIFAKFVQLDSAYTKKESSTGLGLTITKELTELHGGKISLISSINNGSTFIVEIPNT